MPWYLRFVEFTLRRPLVTLWLFASIGLSYIALVVLGLVPRPVFDQDSIDSSEHDSNLIGGVCVILLFPAFLMTVQHGYVSVGDVVVTCATAALTALAVCGVVALVF
jgi:hypothetical protein